MEPLIDRLVQTTWQTQKEKCFQGEIWRHWVEWAYYMLPDPGLLEILFQFRVYCYRKQKTSLKVAHSAEKSGGR